MRRWIGRCDQNNTTAVVLDKFIIASEADRIDDLFRKCFFGDTDYRLYPRRIIRNGDATIVLWEDGTKTVAKCHGDEYDAEKGLAMALARKVWGRCGTMRLARSIEEQGAKR